MGTFAIKNLTFAYPDAKRPALRDITLDIPEGAFIGVCGVSGCGKSTLLRHLKTALTPHGERSGEILFDGRPLAEVDGRTQAAEIGFVLQNPDNQIVTDKVWHELAFGLESLGVDSGAIRLRVAEMASFFGIGDWFMKNVAELSGGQKQLLNLASVMAMQPSALVLDEPTAQLDPIAAAEFIGTLKKINRELGVTVIISEHRLDEVFPAAGRVAVLDGGSLWLYDAPAAVGRELGRAGHAMFDAMPAPVRICTDVDPEAEPPLTVRAGRAWLRGLFSKAPATVALPPPVSDAMGEPVIRVKDVWFKYEKNAPDVIRDLSLTVRKGSWHAIVGGNGAGKTTALSLLSRAERPYRGKILLEGRDLAKYDERELYRGLLGVLPQNPQALFVKKTVALDLAEMLSGRKIPSDERIRAIHETAALVEIEDLLGRHPYDLSGGEQQRAALAKILLLRPRIILLDEPTKGMDSHFKAKLASILNKLRAEGVTIVMVSHDIEFCARHTDVCSLFFDGRVVTTAPTREFFAGNSYYTTAANRMARFLFADAVTNEDVIALCRKNRAAKN